MNKKNSIIMLCLVCGMAVATSVSAQGKLVLREDNIEEILNAMTVEEKVSLLVGGSGNLVPGAAGYTR